jgi:hypothetical protein
MEEFYNFARQTAILGPVTAINPNHQLVILARLSEFCSYHGAAKAGDDPWGYMLRKLKETEEAFQGLKSELLAATTRGLIRELKAGPVDEERFSDYKVLFERLLSSGDFADLAIHLRKDGADTEHRIKLIEQVLAGVKPHHLFVEERKPAGERSAAWEKLILELFKRLDLDRLTEILKRKPREGRILAPLSRRKAAILRRVRRNVAEYCTVLRIPTSPSDTFTPFMLPRIEALIAANLRFLSRFR